MRELMSFDKCVHVYNANSYQDIEKSPYAFSQ